MSGHWEESDLDHLEDLHEQEMLAGSRIRTQVAWLRQHGCPWSEIGAALGISKQAAHRKFRSVRVSTQDQALPVDPCAS